MFSIIIPTYNRVHILAQSLPLVLGMKGVGECEVLVVDDGSTDGTPRFLAEAADRHPNLKPLRQENAGPGEARNLGLARAEKENVLFLDDDIFPSPEVLEAHQKRLRAGGDVSQGRMVWHEDLAGQEIIKFMDARGMQFRLDGYADGERVSYLHVYTANLALPTGAARAVGGFDRAFAKRRYAFEDTAFAWRLEKSGRRICYTPQAWARHLHPMTEEGLLKREYTVGYGLGVARKNYPEIAADLGVDRLARQLGWQWPVLRWLNRSGLPAMGGEAFRRRLALKENFLSGLRDGLEEQ